MLELRTMQELPWLRLVKTLPSNAGSEGFNPSWRVKIPHALWPKTRKHKTEAML